MSSVYVLEKLSDVDIAELGTAKHLCVTFFQQTGMSQMFETLNTLIDELSKKCSLYSLDVRAYCSVYNDCILMIYRILLRTVISKLTLHRITIDTAFTYRQTLSEIHDWGNVEEISFVGEHVIPCADWDPIRCNLNIHDVARSNICDIALYNHGVSITRPEKTYLPEYADALRVNRCAKKTFAVIQVLLLMTMHRKGADKNLAFTIIGFMSANDWK
jgi:hypothetical protein